MLKGRFLLRMDYPNYWDIQNFLHADRTYLGGKNTILPVYGWERGIMLVEFETKGDTHPLALAPGSWSVRGYHR